MPLVTEFKPQDNEKLIFKKHRHWIVFFRSIWIHTLIYFLFIFIMLFLYFTWNYNLQKTIGISKNTLFLILFIIFVVMTIFYVIDFWNHYIDWKYDVLILTDKRLIEINQKFLFGKETRVLLLDEIRSVKSSYHGILGTLFRFGDIHIETASGASSDIRYNYVSDHERLAQLIQEAKQNYKKDK